LKGSRRLGEKRNDRSGIPVSTQREGRRKNRAKREIRVKLMTDDEECKISNTDEREAPE
jgi:hypothetical protein